MTTSPTSTAAKTALATNIITPVETLASRRGSATTPATAPAPSGASRRVNCPFRTIRRSVSCSWPSDRLTTGLGHLHHVLGHAVIDTACGECGELVGSAITAGLAGPAVTWSRFRWENGYAEPEPRPFDRVTWPPLV